MSDWSKFHVREKYTSVLSGFNPFNWDYQKCVDVEMEGKGLDYKKTDGDKQ